MQRLEDPKHPEIDTRVLSPSGSRAERSSGEFLRVSIESQSSGPARLYESLTGEVG